MPQVISKNSAASSNMPKPACASHFRCVLLSALVLVAGFSAGLYIGGQNSSPSSVNQSNGINNQSSSQKVEVKKGSYEDGYQSALDFARKKISDMGLSRTSKAGSNMLTNVAVKSASGNSITVEFDSSLLDILSEGMTTKTIIVPDTVKIEKHIPKDPAEVQKASDEFRLKMEELRKTTLTEDQMKNRPVPPLPYTVENVKISDLKAGDLLNIFYQIDAVQQDTLNAVSVELVNNSVIKTNVREPSRETQPEGTAPNAEVDAKNTTITNPAATPPPTPEAEAAVKNATKTNLPADITPPPTPEAEAAVKNSTTTNPAPTPAEAPTTTESAPVK